MVQRPRQTPLVSKLGFGRFAEDLIENLPIGTMILNKDGIVIRMNKKQEEASQISRKKILGQTFAEAFPKTLRQGLDKPYSQLLGKGTSFDVIIDRYFPQYYSQQMTYRARGTPFLSKKYFVLLHEHEKELYKEKRRVEARTKELRESKNFLEALIDSSPNIVISTDRIGQILIFNKTAEKTFGYKKEKVIGKKIDFLFQDAATRMDADRKKLPYEAEFPWMKRNQISFPASVRVSDIKSFTGKIIGRLYLLSDLSEKKAMEERLYLTEKLALYSELMGGIAHQLNNPLIGVVNFSEMLLKEMEEEDPRKELAETISKAGKECLRIISSVLNSLKDPHLTFMKTDIHQVLRESIDSLRETYPGRITKIRISLSLDAKVPSIQGDSIQLKQSFLNILTNAIQAMPEGGSLEITTHYQERRKEIQIRFTDTGIGIPEEYVHKIFLPFFSLKKTPGQHGLGLSFAYQIVRNHGGHLRVHSKTGRGTTFSVLLPMKGIHG